MYHSMTATAAYVYLIDHAFNNKYNFNLAYNAAMANFKLIALDAALNKEI